MQTRCSSECKGCALCGKESSTGMNINDAILGKPIYSKGTPIYTSIISNHTYSQPSSSLDTSFVPAPAPATLFSTHTYSFLDTRQKNIYSVAQGYNPLVSTAYNTCRLPQLKCTRILSSLVLPIISQIENPTAQHIRLNEILGLPPVHSQYSRLTKEVLRAVISAGGLKEIDEQRLWPRICKEIGHQTDDFTKLRMYYIIVCYPYEQVLYIEHNKKMSEQPIMIVYIESKKTDIYPEVVRSIAKKKTHRKTQYVQIADTSGPAEAVYALNYFFSESVQKKRDLLCIIDKISILSCSDPEVQPLYTCKELLFVREQLHTVLVQWITHHLNNLDHKESADLESISGCHSYFAHAMEGGRHSCSRCVPLSLPSFFFDALCFFAKSTAVCVNIRTVSAFVSIIQGLSKSQLSILDKHGQKMLISVWNILREKKDAETAEKVRMFVEGPVFSSVVKQILSFLQYPILSLSDLRSMIKKGQLESILLVLSLMDRHSMVQLPMKRLAQIWRHLFAYISSKENTSSGSMSIYLSAKSCLDIISAIIHRYLISDSNSEGVQEEKQEVISVFNTDEGLWVTSYFSEDLPSSVYPLCMHVFLNSKAPQEK